MFGGLEASEVAVLHGPGNLEVDRISSEMDVATGFQMRGLDITFVARRNGRGPPLKDN